MEQKIEFNSHYKKLLADTVTPVNMYLKLRDHFAKSILLESSDYHGNENSFSFICCNPIAEFMVNQGKVKAHFPSNEKGLKSYHREVEEPKEVLNLLKQFAGSFDVKGQDFKFPTHGLFGYMAYEAVQYFEDIKLEKSKTDKQNIPEIWYSVYSIVIALDHFKNELYIFYHAQNGDDSAQDKINEIESLIFNRNIPFYNFSTEGGLTSNLSDKEFKSIVEKGMEHCFRGDVFQIVLSRQFQRGFKGDEFNVYRSLRSINPSPYLFYFDYGDFKIFGSSPEAQIVIKDQRATIYPIAGTFRRTGNDQADAELAQKLHADPKENSEHVMLVDLARNDLSHSSDEVKVETYKEIQFYSHVIHLVSKVSGILKGDKHPLDMVASTFPAGTLSGAPKHMAMQLIDRYEKTKRGYYGGAIGFMAFNGDFNHAIMIRSFLSRDNQLYYQAGAGIVAKSDSDSEVQEVYNKLEALNKALEFAGEIKY